MATKSRLLILGLILVLGLGGGIWYVLRPAKEPVVNANIVAAFNAPSDSGFKQATELRALTFPADHGPHPDYQTEWWYYTGNLETAEGREFGYQLTFFRQAFSSQPVSRTAQWATNAAYLAHFTLTDVETGEFYAFERLERGGPAGLAGAAADPYRVFIASWQAAGTGSTVNLTAGDAAIAIDLRLEAEKPPTLQGNGGLSAKGTAPGQASYYYSLTRMKTVGTVSINQQAFTITGLSWFDHEWSTSSLSQNQVGWEWFGLHLDDGRDITWWQLRRDDGRIDFAGGSITGPLSQTAGVATSDLMILAPDAATLTRLDTWTSPATDIEYPIRWRLQIPQANLDLEITPLIPNQELRLISFTYWEGAVAISGSAQGRGYAELTGYGQGASPLR